MTIRETVSVSSAEINGATAYEVAGTAIFLCCFALFSPKLLQSNFKIRIEIHDFFFSCYIAEIISCIFIFCCKSLEVCTFVMWLMWLNRFICSKNEQYIAILLICFMLLYLLLHSHMLAELCIFLGKEVCIFLVVIIDSNILCNDSFTQVLL